MSRTSSQCVQPLGFRRTHPESRSIRFRATRSLVIGSILVVAYPLSGQQVPDSLSSVQAEATVQAAPPIKRFPKDLARNFVALWSSDNFGPLLVGAVATAAAIPADQPITDYFSDATRWQGFDRLGRQLGKSQVLGPAIGVSFLVSRATSDVQFQSLTYSLAQGFLVTNTVTDGLKILAGRERPDATSRYSFPSGHTSNSFMLATVVSRHYGWKAGATAYAFAAYVGASRLESRKHYLTDIIVGATLGYVVGLTVSRDPAIRARRRVNWGVSIPPGGGAALSVGIRF